MPLDYDQIGKTYSSHRQPDPRIAQAILVALGDSKTVVNVGAGVGSYEPSDRLVIAVEPSREMTQQRRDRRVPAVIASAEQLPFMDESFDAAIAILTIHHWSDWRTGLRELWRVTRDRIILLTWEPTHPGFWLVQDYFPDILECDRKIFPAISEIESVLGKIEVQSVPIPHNCTDGFLGAYWRRPSAYLDAGVRLSISSFSRIDDITERLDRLQFDIETGAWEEKNAAILEVDQLDIGYRLITCSKTK